MKREHNYHPYADAEDKSINTCKHTITRAETERGSNGTRTQGLSLTVRALYH